MMKLCDAHFQYLIVAIWHRGLVAYIPDSAEASQARWAEIRTKGHTKETFEPVHFAAMAIMINANNFGGIVTSESGVHCPICADPQSRAPWIDHAAMDAYNEAIKPGLTPQELAPN